MRGRPIVRSSNVSSHFGQVLVVVAVLANGGPTLRFFLAKVWGWARGETGAALKRSAIVGESSGQRKNVV
jgi:hypothetical protein